MIAVVNQTRQRLPAHDWATIAKRVLGPDYDLSLAFLGAGATAKLNRRLRQRDYSPNVLSWPLSPKSGEIIITPTVARREAINYGHSPAKHLLYLFIHALLHLKGHRHGSKMEREEIRLLNLFAVNGKTNHRRS